MTYCAKCGAPLPPGAQFCPRCGTPLDAPPPAPAPAAHVPAPAPAPAPAAPAPPPPSSARSALWIVPLVLLALGGLAWLILAGLPFGGRDRGRAAEVPRVETIAEGTAPPSTPRESATIIDVPDAEPREVPAPQPAPRQVPDPQPAPREVPDPQPALLNDEQASATLRAYMASRNYYDVADDCVRVESRGFRNRGYDYEVWHSCESSGASRLLGKWRVDAKTREVFRQYENGRYLRP